MSTRRKVAVLTATRAEYGLLYWVLREIMAAPTLELQLIVSGTHLSHAHGHTVDAIARDGVPIARRVEMLVSGDTPAATARSVALGVIGFADALEALRPDVFVVLGDRFEVLAAAQAALFHGVPVAHIAGGDVSEGAFDESMRHAITKLSHLHFVTNELSAARVRQLGEDPARVFCTGSPGLDFLRRTPLLEGDALVQALGAPLGTRNVLVTFHPVTAEAARSRAQFDQLLWALDRLPDDVVVWCTGPNADPGGRDLDDALQRWVSAQPTRRRYHVSLGQQRYVSLMQQVDAVIGNSSSGLYEAPSFGVPTVNVGGRQRGRLMASSVFDVEADGAAIEAAIAQALARGRQPTENPYGDGNSAPRIAKLLATVELSPAMLTKVFHTL